MADALPQDSSITWVELISTLESNFLPGSNYQVWEPSPTFAKAVLTALMRKRQDPECFLVIPPPPQ